MNLLITKGLGNNSVIVGQGFGGFFYKLKGWVTTFKREVIDWALKLDPTKSVEKLLPFTLFEVESRIISVEVTAQELTFERTEALNSVERLEMTTGVFHDEIVRDFEKNVPSITGMDKEVPLQGVEHLGTNTSVECSLRSQVFDEAHEYFETPQL